MQPRRTHVHLPPGLANCALAVAIGLAGAAVLLAWATPCEPAGHLCSLWCLGLWRHCTSPQCRTVQCCAHTLDLEADSGLADLAPAPPAPPAPAPLTPGHMARRLARRWPWRAWWALWLCVGVFWLAGCGGNPCPDDDLACDDTATQQPVRCDLYPQRCV
jgi:hypothetical protein